MNEHLRERIVRKLESLNDERGYQILDYAEFLESRYAERQTPGATPFTRFAEAVEDRLRAGKVSANTIAEAMNLMNKAANVLNGALAAGRSITSDIVSATRTSGPMSTTSTTGTAPSGASAPGATPGSASRDQAAPSVATTAEASSTAHDTKEPGSGEERL